LVDPIFKRNADVVRISFDAADPDAADDVACACESAAAVGRRRHFRGQLVDFDRPLDNALHELEIVGADVGESEFRLAQFRDGNDVGDQFASEADTARADDGYLWSAQRNLPFNRSPVAWP
jgi:hypothetical protein